jgi:hypothetical protein
MEIPRDLHETLPIIDYALIRSLNNARNEVSGSQPPSGIAENGIDETGTAKVSVERLRTLQTISRWATAEMAAMEREAFEDGPFDVVYFSATDPDGAFRKRFKEETDAKSFARDAEYSAVSGSYKVVRRRLPNDPEDLPAALEPRPIEDGSEIAESM